MLQMKALLILFKKFMANRDFSVHFYLGPGVRWDCEICVILVNLGNLTIVVKLKTVALHGSTLYLFVHYYKPEIVIFECPRYLLN